MDEITEIEQKVERARREQAKAEARRDAAKEQLTELLKKLKAKYGVSSPKELKKKLDEAQKEYDEALQLLKEATSELS